MMRIDTVQANNRKSTQQLLQLIYEAMEKGEHEFEIYASGQHDIGGPLWTADGKMLKFVVHNPGQRVGSMALEGTDIVVEGSAPADVGWLNAGATIVVKGDGGDTSGHCAASGKIYIGGRVGTRSGSLMKYDPKFTAPELWVLKNTGSFSFEFMGGGIGVVCGVDCDDFDSVLGDRACVGMVGGTVFFRGPVKGVSEADVKITNLSDQDKSFLQQGLPEFLARIGREELLGELCDMSGWKKIVARTYEERAKVEKLRIRDFRQEEWVPGGIFGDVFPDNGVTKGLVAKDEGRLRVPEWENARYSAPCEWNCPAGIPSQTRFNLLRNGRAEEAYAMVLEYTPFPGSVCGNVCPNLCMQECTRCNIDAPAQIKELGLVSADVKLDKPSRQSGRRVAVIGSGVGGLTTAWVLALRGHQPTVFEEDTMVGGKIAQVIPDHRLSRKILQTELQRIQDMGVEVRTGQRIDRDRFRQLQKEYDAVVIATGAHVPKVIPWKGSDKLVKGLDFLKRVNKGEKVRVGKKVIVIGCGNAGMDVISAAYQMGANEVTGIDVAKPLAFEHEIDAVRKLGAKLKYPVITKEITDKGIITDTGELLEADTVIISIGETPDLDFLPEELAGKVGRGFITAGDNFRLSDTIYAIGDATRQGLLVDAIAHGRQVALELNDRFNNVEYRPQPKRKVVPQDKLSLEYFEVCRMDKLPDPTEDHQRCISCGTCRDCKMCLESCPEGAIRRLAHEDGTFEYVSDPTVCIGCSICSGVCPCGIWTMYENEIKFAID